MFMRVKFPINSYLKKNNLNTNKSNIIMFISYSVEFYCRGFWTIRTLRAYSKLSSSILCKLLFVDSLAPHDFWYIECLLAVSSNVLDKHFA